MKPQLLRASKHKAELEYIQSIRELSRARRHHEQKVDAYQTHSRDFWSELKRPTKRGETPDCNEGNAVDVQKLERIYIAQDKLRLAAKNCQNGELRLKSRETVAVKNKVRFDAIESLLKKALTERKRKGAEIVAEEVDALQSAHSFLEPASPEEAYVSKASTDDGSRCSAINLGQRVAGLTTNQTTEKPGHNRIQVSNDLKVSSIKQSPTEKSITIRSLKPGLQGMSVKVSKAEGKQVQVNVGVGNIAVSSSGLTELISNRIRAAFPHLKDITIKVGGETEAKNDFQSTSHGRGLKRGTGELYDEY
jgi:hypothetical protein